MPYAICNVLRAQSWLPSTTWLPVNAPVEWKASLRGEELESYSPHRELQTLLLMVQKSCIRWYGKYPILYRVSYIPGGDRRISEPSTPPSPCCDPLLRPFRIGKWSSKLLVLSSSRYAPHSPVMFLFNRVGNMDSFLGRTKTLVLKFIQSVYFRGKECV